MSNFVSKAQVSDWPALLAPVSLSVTPAKQIAVYSGTTLIGFIQVFPPASSMTMQMNGAEVQALKDPEWGRS